MFFGQNVHSIVSTCYTNVPYDWSVRCLCQRTHGFLQERQVDKLPRNHCSFGKSDRLLEYLPKVCGKSLRFDRQSHRLRFGEFDGTSPSKASACSIFRRQMTTFRLLPEYLQVGLAKAYLQAADWLRLFFSQEANVGRLTPKVRCTPRMLERSW